MLLENFQKSFDTDKLLRLLGAKEGQRVSSSSLRRINLLTEKIDGMLTPQLSYRTIAVSHVDRSGILLADGTRFKSPKLAKALAGAEAACCFLATVGPAVDMEIERLMQRRRFADAYVLDAMGSMSAENIVEQFYQRAARHRQKAGGGVTLRFSPGYCDWPIQQQRPLFRLFAQTDLPDVTLNDSCLMSPRKSVSGLFGLLPPGVHRTDPAYNPCNHCKKRNCIARRDN